VSSTPLSESIDRLSRRPDALDRKRQFVEWPRRFASGILDRQSGDPGRHASGDAFCHVRRLHPITRREVGIDQKIDRGGNFGNVRQAPIAGDGDIGIRQLSLDVMREPVAYPSNGAFIRKSTEDCGL
jgi:hypothetical protein